MKLCPKCSTQNPGSAKFCKECGSSLEDVADSSTSLSAAASGILNKAGNLLIEGSKKIGGSVPNEPGEQETISPPGIPSDSAGQNTDSPEYRPRPQSTWKDTVFNLLRQKRVWIAALAVVAVIVAINVFGGTKSKRFVGQWKMYPNQMPGYGMSLVFDKNTIDARGDFVNYGGFMKFKYKVVNDSELILEYDWTFNEWPWSVPYTKEIPLNYSMSEDGNTLTLIWSGTSFVLLDNTSNTDYFNQNGCIMAGSSITFTKVQ